MNNLHLLDKAVSLLFERAQTYWLEADKLDEKQIALRKNQTSDWWVPATPEIKELKILRGEKKVLGDACQRAARTLLREMAVEMKREETLKAEQKVAK